MKIFKRTLSALLALVMVIGMVPMPVAAEESVAASGDVDGNSKIQTNDAKLILQRYTDIINAYPSESAGSDVDGNGVDNSIDASLILQYISKMIDTLPVDKNLAEAVPEDLPAKTPDSATSFTASAGETISVPFSVTNNPGFMCYGLTLQYDTDALILEAVNESAHAGGFLFVENTNNGKISYAGSSDITDDGDLFTATFRVSSDAADGSYEIVANLDEASTANETCEYVSLDITGVTVTVNQPPTQECTHEWGDWAEDTAGTCNQQAITKRTCVLCSATETVEGKFGGHVYANGTCTSCGRNTTNNTVEHGDRITIPFSVSNNPGFVSYGLTLQYNSDALILESVECGTVCNDGFFTANVAIGKIAYATLHDVFDTGDLFTATFGVSNTAADGTYDIVVNLDETSIVNAANEYVSFDISGASVTVSNTSEAPIDPPQDQIVSGTCGESWIWTMDANGILTITGIGAMEGVEAINSYISEDWQWVLGDNDILTISGTGAMEGKDTSWGTQINYVVIAEGVTSISKSAFENCNSLKNVNLPDSLISIGDRAFMCSGITNISIPANVSSLGISVFDGCTNLTHANIPDGISHIPQYAFCGCESLTEIAIPDSVTSIGGQAFDGCSSFTSIIIPETVTSIDGGAFANCTGITTIALPKGITSIGPNLFGRCTGLTSIEIPNLVTSIGNYSFYECKNLKEITFTGDAPSFIKEEGSVDIHFTDVTATAYYPANNPTWTSEVMQNYGGTITWVPYGEVVECDHKYDCEQTPPATCTESGINTYTCMHCGDSYTEVVPSRGHTWSEWRPKEPGTCQKPAVEYKICISCSEEETRDGSIGEHNFVETSVTNPTCTMEGLRESTCSYCSMVSKSAIPATEHDFQNGSCTVCGTVDNYCGPNATWTFAITSAYGALLRISGTGAVTEAPWLNLYKDQIQFIEIENGITSIVSEAFRGCTNLCAVTIPDSVTAIEGGTFLGCTSLGGISLPENLTSIASNAFSGCSSLSEITIPKGVATIEPYTFYGCSSLKKVTLTSGLITIGSWAFNECTGFSEIVIPATVRQIDFGAFRSCSNLSRIIFEGNAPTFGDGVFENVTTKAFYPQDNATWTESVRQNYKGNITWIPYDVTVGAPKDTGGYCGDNAIWEYNPNTYVLTISGYGAIYDYWNWETGTTTAPWKDYASQASQIVISDDITRIGDGALVGFSSVWWIDSLPSKLTSIGDYAFCGISVMHSLQIPEGVTEIGEGAFKDCLNFGTVMIPASVTSIGKGAIVVGCEVDAGNQYYSSENGFLYNKDKTLLIRVPMKYQSYYGTTSVVIPDSVTTIADGALMGCSMVNEVIIPKSVSSIGENAFASSSISNIYFSGSAPNFGANVFEGITATVSYPSSGYWPADVLQQYGGTIIWVCYESGAPEGLEYTVSTNSVKITGYSGTDSTLVIPETIDGKPVTSLSEFVFRGNKTLKHLIIPSGVTTLPMFAFMDCATLESVILPDTLISIGDYAFYRCYALKEIVVPKNVEYLFSRAFGNCTSLSKIVLRCSAHSIVQGSGVDPTLGTDLFLNVKADVYYPQYDASWTDTIRKQYGGTITWIPYSNEADLACSHSWNSGTVVTAATCTTDGSMTHTCSKCGASKTVTIPATGHSYLNGACPVCGTASQLPPSCGNNATWKFDAATGTLTISGSGPMADFQNSTLTPWYSYKDKIIHVVIEEGITSIGNYAFMTFTRLANITIPNGVTYIGAWAFEECYSLEEVIVPEGVAIIGDVAFAFCWSLRKVVLPGSLATFGNSVFASAKFTDIYYHVDAILCLKDHMSEEGNPWPCTWIPYGECTHAWNEGTIITEPDCTNEGSLTHTCIKCNVTETAAIPAKGHTEQWIPGESATCTKPGVSSPVVCAVCGVVIKTSEPILALGHKEKTIPGKSATCTEAGLTDGKKCSRCGEITVAQEVIPALGHTEVVTVTGNPASCTESGLSDSTKCSVCDVQLKTQEVIPPTGHAEVTITGKPASCTESGLTDGTKCSVCDTIIKAQESIPATGHTEAAITGKPASCTENGLTDGMKCSVCDTTIKAQESIPATGHTEEAVAGKAASCTENGLTDGKKCSICHTVTEAQTEIPALGHIWSDWTETKSSTCTKKGVIERACETCNTVETKDGELAEHQYTAVVTAPTCTEKGYTTYTCICGNTYVGDYVDQIEHTIVLDEEEDVTCTTNGLTAGSHCSVCGKILVKQEVIYAHHTNEIISGKPASCTESGLTDGVRCTVCEKILTAQTEIPATGHNYQTEDNITFTCTCGDSFNVDIKDIIDEIDPDTATKEDIDQAVDKVQEIDTKHLQIAMAVDHNNTGVVEQIAALEEMVEVDVRVEVSEASIENFEANDVTIIGAKLNNREDDEKDITLNIDETKNIKDLHIPKYCDAHSAVMFSMTLANVENPHELDVPVKIRLPIPNGMNPHKLVILHYNDDGSIPEEITPQIEHEKGQFYAIIVLSGFSDFTMAMTHEHSFSDWEVIQAATCVTIGSKKRTCNCGEVEEGEIPATGHTIVIDTKVEATCVATGLTEGKHCSVCDAILVKQAEIAKKNHNYENGSCSMCGEAEPQKPLYTLGDVDGNGKIQTNDAKLILQHIVRMPVTLNLDAADVDGNSKIQTNDAKLILQYIVKIITHFPAQTT